MFGLVLLTLTLMYEVIFITPVTGGETIIKWAWKRPFLLITCLLGFASVNRNPSWDSSHEQKMGVKWELHLNRKKYQLSNSWLSIVVTLKKKKKKKVQATKSRFLFTCCLKKEKRKKGKDVGCFICSRTVLPQRLKTVNIKACFGRDVGEEKKRRVKREQNLTGNGPYQESLQRKKK